MKNYRNNPPIKLADSMVILIKDFLQLIEIHITNNGKNFKKLSMPTTSNILQYFTEDGTKVSIRPSGTEPKIKFYIEVRSRINSHKEMRIAEAVADVKIKSILKSLNL